MTVATYAEIAQREPYWNEHPPTGGYSETLYATSWDGNRYRQDCSGYLSSLMQWLTSPDTQYIHDNLATPITADELQPGDVMLVPPLNGQAGHVVVFDGWTPNGAHSAEAHPATYYGSEFGWGAQPAHREITYPYSLPSGEQDPRPFAPYRLVGGPNDPQAPAPAPVPAPAHPTGGVPSPFPLPVAPADPGRVFGPLSGPNDVISGEYPGDKYLTAHQAAIRLIQTALNVHNAAGLAVDGKYGKLTTAAVRAYQTAKAIEVDGETGPQTWGALGL